LDGTAEKKAKTGGWSSPNPDAKAKARDWSEVFSIPATTMNNPMETGTVARRSSLCGNLN
jgi:hypothetical protein